MIERAYFDNCADRTYQASELEELLVVPEGYKIYSILFGEDKTIVRLMQI